MQFVDNPAIKDKESAYTTLTVDVLKVIKSWQASLFSFEWLRPDGSLKNIEELPENEQEKRRQVQNTLDNNRPIEKPVLGIGMLENVEIGCGRAILLTLAANGIQQLPVHVPNSHKEDFKPYSEGIE